MSDLSFFGNDAWWWPYLFILLAGWLPTGIWRYVGALSSGACPEDSAAIRLVKAVATALVAAVIARLVLYPTGSLALSPDAARLGGLAAGFLVYCFVYRSILFGILVSQIVLFAGAWQAGLL